LKDCDFVYVSRHGPEGSYATCYSEAELKKDAGRMKAYLGAGKNAYVYFNNDAYGFAPRNAGELRAMIDNASPSGNRRKATVVGKDERLCR
jgi:uncharacterized protein YecE (DUF72 family)